MQSHIPVMTPRPPQSSLPSSLSTPQLGLTHAGKYLAVSGSPSYPATFTNGAPSSYTSGGLAPFRSFRNLLSFGTVKNSPVSPGGTSQSAAASRTSFGNLRRSIHGERSVSTPQLAIPKVQDGAPVLTIELSHRVDEPLFDKDELRNRLHLEPSSPETASPSPLSSCASVEGADLPVLRPSDLSTIMEAESSGISKHLPSLDASSFRTSRSANSRTSPKTVAAQYLSTIGSDSQDTSVLDLSTSNISNEVLAALSASGRQQGWLNGVVVEDADPPADGASIADFEPSFNLSALDPDLAALLSPHRAKNHEPAHVIATAALSPPLFTPPLTDGPRSSRNPSPRMLPKELSTAPPSPSSSARSPTLTQRPPCSPSHLNRSTSLTRSTNARLVPPSSLARLTRSSSDKPSLFSRHSPSPSPTKSETLGRQSLQLPRKDASPLLVESPLPRRPTSSEGKGADPRRPSLSRIVAPSRHLAAANNARASLRQLPTPSSSPGWESRESTSPHSMSSSTRHSNGHRPSLDVGGERPLVQGRDRSASLSENTDMYHPSVVRSNECLGPRTAKAFAAAGLLDNDRDAPGPSSSRPGSRFGLGASRSERDFRSQYAPSRTGFSEIGSTSWSRRSGSISRTVTSSETVSVLGTPNSDSVHTAPRTVYSAASTAPTSVSAVSSAQKHLESEIHQLQEKHSTETGALLNALADSQRTTRMLREENAHLRDRVHYLEDELAEAQEAIQKMQFSSSTLSRNPIYRHAGRHATEPSRRPPQAHSRLQTLLLPTAEDVSSDYHTQNSETSQHTMPMKIPSKTSLLDAEMDVDPRRFSSTSSIFPAPPSNMPMLLNEDGGSLSMSPPSPPLLGKFSMRQSHHRRPSSVGNISPTTANFSIMTGSPRSLDLQPEHERLLGDMPSLDLHAEGYESHVYQG